jgi:hypothetical protein
LTKEDAASGLKGKGWLVSKIQGAIDKEKKELALEPFSLRVVTLLVTFVTMAMSLSFISLLPPPLPLLLAALVAFVSYQYPQVGMPVGSGVLCAGLIYHLADLNFISMLGSMYMRIGFIVALMVIFIVLPFVFHRCKHVLAINLGILSAMVLFFQPIYFLAIPIIFASAVFFGKNAGLSIVYYSLIAVPLQVLQYFKTIVAIPQSEWWLAPGSSPPVLIPISSILKDFQASMTQFRLYDSSKLIYTIYRQITYTPEITGRSIQDALKQYLDSFPGILMFLVIVAGIVLALVFFMNTIFKQTNIPYGDRFLASFMAILGTMMFFVFLNALHAPLAFTADIDGMTILYATLATAVFTMPLSIITYSPKRTATTEMMVSKADELKAKLKLFEDQLKTVKGSIPVNVNDSEGRMLLLKDTLDDISHKATTGFFEVADLDKAYDDLNKNVSFAIDDLPLELNNTLSEFQIYVNGEYSNWLGKLREIGIDLKHPVNVNYQKEMTLEERINTIKAVLSDGDTATYEVIDVLEPIYSIIRSLYDPDLPEECQVVTFAKEQLKNQAPWKAIGGLYSSLVNWKRQYGQEVSKSIEYLHTSLTPLIELNSKSEKLAPILGDKLTQIIGDSKKAQAIQSFAEKKQLNVLNIITLRNLSDSFLDVSKDVLSIFFEEIKSTQQSIEDLLPTSDYLWEKNETLNERLQIAMEVLYNPKLQINQVLEKLPQYLSYIDESMQTLTVYRERKEFLLNYPMAEASILEQMKIKKKLTPLDLPFESKFAQEYLRIFYLKRFSEYAYDKENAWLTKKP